MTTVTGLTADRMLAIEAASVVDGDVDANGNLILTKHDGSQVNAGPVIGPKGDPGPVGQDKSVLAAVSVLDVGMTGQIRAGRQLSPADFGNLGLSAPLGLWNLSDLSDVSGNGRNLNNKGAVGFASGINGVASSAAQFTGSTAQALYISDSGANDSFRIKTGSWGCWFRTAKRGTTQLLIGKSGGGANTVAWNMLVDSTNVLRQLACVDGNVGTLLFAVSDVADDRWHFAVGTFDGSVICSYVDGVLEASSRLSGAMYGSALPFNIGASQADASNAAQAPHFGRIDEAFVTADVLTDDQVRNLYCTKIAHTLGTAPVRVSLNVHRKRKGATWAVADFPTQPLRLHNFSAGSMGDQGSNNQTLTNPGNAVSVSGADGSAGNAMSFNGAQSLYSTDAGLPNGVAARSYGCWFKGVTIGVGVLMGWGTNATGDARLLIDANGLLTSYSGADQPAGNVFVANGLWNHAVVVEDNGAIDGAKRKLYLNGRLSWTSIVMNPITLAGANFFRIAASPTGVSPFTGQIDGVFVCDYVLTAAQIAALYAKGAQDLGASPKNSGDHVERMDAANLLATFDTLESQHTVDLAVA